MSNVYYGPEDSGLEIVLVVDSELSYEYDMFVVWRDASGSLYAADDSGCSCSYPFEDLTLEDLQKLGASTPAKIHVLLDEWAATSSIDVGDVADGHLEISQLKMVERKPCFCGNPRCRWPKEDVRVFSD
jgi:hypothetical protein